MKLKRLASAIALGLGLGVMVAPAFAGTLHFFEDDDLEWVLRKDAAGVYQQIVTGNLTAGDVLFSVFEIPTYQINGINGIPAGKELTGVAAVEVLTGGAGNPNFTFGAWADFGVTIGKPLPVGAMVAMWTNDLIATGDLDVIGANSGQLSCTTLAGCTTQAIAGDLFQIDGFVGDPDEFWTALATTDNLATIKAGASTTPFVVFNAGLSNQFNALGPVGYINAATGFECVDSTGCVQFLVSGTVQGGGGLADTNIVGRSDFQGEKFVIPEPTTVALVGMALLGLGVTARRRNKV